MGNRVLISLSLSYHKEGLWGGPHQFFFGYDTDYRIVLCCLHKNYKHVVGTLDSYILKSVPHQKKHWRGPHRQPFFWFRYDSDKGTFPHDSTHFVCTGARKSRYLLCVHTTTYMTPQCHQKSTSSVSLHASLDAFGGKWCHKWFLFNTLSQNLFCQAKQSRWAAHLKIEV